MIIGTHFQDLFTFYVNETSPEWTIVGVLRLQATDKRNQLLLNRPVFSLTDSDVPFSLNTLTGTIRLKQQLDFETIKSYRLSVELKQQEVCDAFHENTN